MKTDGAARDDADGATCPWVVRDPEGRDGQGEARRPRDRGRPGGSSRRRRTSPRASAPPRAPLEAAPGQQ